MSAERTNAPWLNIAWGALLVTAGLIFWLDQLGRLDAEAYVEWWPVAVIAIGVAHLPHRRWTAAAIWIAVGAIFLMPKLGYVSIAPWRVIALWPLLISIGGVTLVIHALRAASGGTRFNASAVMAANIRSIRSQDLAGGSAVAVMGGCEVDLSGARPASNEIAVDVLAFWGGVEIRVPAGWRVVNRAALIFGGYEDKTAPALADAPRVVLRGSAIMGGIEVKNSREQTA